MAERESKAKQEIREILTKSKSFDEFSKVLDKEWPEGTYTAVKQKTGNISKMKNTDYDIAAIIDPKEQCDKGLTKQIDENYPEATELIKDGVTVGQIEYLVKTTRTSSSRKRGEEERSKFIYLIPYDIDKSEVNDMKDVYNLLVGCRDQIKEHNRKNIAFITAEGLNRIYLRKLLEFVFKETEMQVKLLTPGDRKEAGRNAARPLNKMKTTEQSVLVKKGGKSYAELLKSVKTSVDPEKIGVKIKSIKQTGKGDLLLSVTGGDEKARSLKTEIETQLKDVDVTMRKSEATLHISDVDPTVTEEEIRDALNAHIDIDKNLIKITSLRPSRNQNHMATAILPREAARELSRKGKIKIGWVLSRVRERVSVTRCFRCLEFGHIQQGCAGVDRSGECLNCGKTGHKAKDCKNESFCAKCQIGEHRTDSTRCPHYKKIVEDVSKRKGRRN
ncbi:hypothetical protein NQ314_018609 [Rhamnusium bicolor]|uniref:CCHC-type domain-containing protein n=1 Tax=Rhamnusium bicolor TaxID=1586634 RepID=A0AAV8WQM3_9CUCU|nr:hypothetical protein NQ314_018609 [Rhamnusium bicolor]